MGKWAAWITLMVGVTLMVACVTPAQQLCGDLWCPVTTTCVPERGTCWPQASVAACEGAPDGAACDVANSPGVCDRGVCINLGCGNGRLEAGEICDDGNTEAGDGCAADCRSDESCGNGVIDRNEACDCGRDAATKPAACATTNNDATTAQCDSQCTRYCGDGLVAGSEDCEPGQALAASCTDFGFYGGNLACSQACRFETVNCAGRCGDGMVQTDAGEECDGGPPSSQCTAFGYDYGALKCSARCFADITGNCHRFGWKLVGSAELVDFWASESGNAARLHQDGRLEWQVANQTSEIQPRAFSATRFAASYASAEDFGWITAEGVFHVALPTELQNRVTGVTRRDDGMLFAVDDACQLWTRLDNDTGMWRMQQLTEHDGAALAGCSRLAVSDAWLAVQTGAAISFVRETSVKAQFNGELRGPLDTETFAARNATGMVSVMLLANGNEYFTLAVQFNDNSGRFVADFVPGATYQFSFDAFYIDRIPAPSGARRVFVTPGGRYYLYGTTGTWFLDDYLAGGTASSEEGRYIAAGLNATGVVVTALEDRWAARHTVFGREGDLFDLKAITSRGTKGWVVGTAPLAMSPQLWRYALNTTTARVQEFPMANRVDDVQADFAGRVFAIGADPQGAFLALSANDGAAFSMVRPPAGCTLTRAASDGVIIRVVGRCGETSMLWRVTSVFEAEFSASEAMQQVAMTSDGKTYVAFANRLVRIEAGAIVKEWPVSVRALTASRRECYFIRDDAASVADISQVWRIDGDAISPIRVARGTLVEPEFLVAGVSSVSVLGRLLNGEIHQPAAQASVHETPLVR